MYTDWCHLLGGGGAGVECYTYYKILLFARLNWSVNGLQPRVYYYHYYYAYIVSSGLSGRALGIRLHRIVFAWYLHSVCNFQSMKAPVELNSLLSNFFCCIAWFSATIDDLQTRPLRQVLLSLWGNGLAV